MNPDDAEGAQAPLVAWLGDATAQGAPVERVDTHISRVFLTGDRALKLKRAVATNYLDFRDPADRARFCRREIEVNRAAGDLYRGVRPALRAGAGFRLGGLGETPEGAVDWLVEMARFDRRCEFDRLLDAGRLDAPLAEALADAVAAMHAAAPRAPAAPLGGRIDQIAGAVAAAAPALSTAAAAWATAARARADALARPLAARARAGRVRRCHGDLHLRNVVLRDGRPLPFDAIEFDEAIAEIDTAYDLAFLLADLCARRRPDLAQATLSRWAEAADDHAALAVLPLFLSMRFAVLALTAGARGQGAEAAARLTDARAALAPPPAPRLLAVGGLSGTGKTTLARALAPDLPPAPGACVLRSDAARKRLLGLSPETPAPPEAYGYAVGEAVARRLLRQAGRCLRSGWSAALDATFLDADMRAEAARLAERRGVAFHGLWLAAPAEIAAARADARTGDASDATGAVVRAQAAGRDAGGAPAGWTRVDAADGPALTEARARAALGAALTARRGFPAA